MRNNRVWIAAVLAVAGQAVDVFVNPGATSIAAEATGVQVVLSPFVGGAHWATAIPRDGSE